MPWRFVISSHDRVCVSRSASRRRPQRDRQKSALRAVAPLLILIALLPLVIGATVRRMLQPLKRVAEDLESPSEADWSHIPDRGLPLEIRPFVAAIKRLLARVAESVVVQRRFLADAAHELRSPLTALSLQAERLEAADMSGEARIRLVVLRRALSGRGACSISCLRWRERKRNPPRRGRRA